jgi:hypothetical protein
MNFATIEGILAEAHADGRTGLFEHECYALLAESGAEAAPANRLIPPGSQPTTRDLEAVGGTKVVLKVVSPDITHKTEAKGVRIVANEPGAVEAAHELMTTQAPATYARWLEDHGHEMPEALTSLSGGTLEARLRERSRGVLLCRFMESDAQGFATELFVGIRAHRRIRPHHLGRAGRRGNGGPGQEHPPGRGRGHRAHRPGGRRPFPRVVPRHAVV